jgi:hypothetical protein
MTDSLFVRSGQALSADVGEDVVALHVARGHCFGMENVTATVWKLIERPISLDAICTSLVERYDVQPERCRLEVEALLNDFEREGLVERA